MCNFLYGAVNPDVNDYDNSKAPNGSKYHLSLDW